MNTRVAVRMSQEAYDALSTISEISRVPRGRILGEFLEAAYPGLISVAAAYRAAMAVEGEERQAIFQGLLNAEERLTAALRTEFPDMPEYEAPDPDRAARRGTAGAGAGASDPPVTNRGVSNPSKGGH